jgi:hypothetical protein
LELCPNSKLNTTSSVNPWPPLRPNKICTNPRAAPLISNSSWLQNNSDFDEPVKFFIYFNKQIQCH